jgi:ATP-binding protein involved in chromosome partitioning
VSESLSTALGAVVPLLGQIPLDPRLRESGDDGTPLVLCAPETVAAQALAGVAQRLTTRARGLAGMSLNISPVRK